MTRYIDVDRRRQRRTRKPSNPGGHHILKCTVGTRAVADVLEANVATVEEARVELEAAGCDERTIASVLALIPKLRKAS